MGLMMYSFVNYNIETSVLILVQYATETAVADNTWFPSWNISYHISRDFTVVPVRHDIERAIKKELENV